MGGKVTVARFRSLRERALLATALGLAVLAGMVIFDNYDEAALVSAQSQVEALRQLDSDNRALGRAVSEGDAAVGAYISTGTTSAGGPREELLAEYLQANREASTELDKVEREAGANGLTAAERPVRSSLEAWQAWAHGARLAADAHTATPAQANAAGRAAVAGFQSAEANFTQAVQEAAAAAGTLQRQRNAAHMRVFYAGLLAEALVVALLAIAVVNGLLNPIARLTRTAGDLASGVPTRVPYTDRRDEVGSLARALAAWQQAASDIARVFERSPLGMARLDADGVILEANPSLRRMLSGADLVGLRYADLLEPQQQAGFRHALQELARGEEQTFALEARLVSPGRAPFWGSLTVASVPATDSERMAYALVMLEDADLRKNQELELAHRAAHDPLTGLPNRLLFRDRLDQALRAARRRRGRLSVLLIDLDRFKPINDRFGHHAGDDVLRQVASRLRACFREADTVARIGGDEFAAVLAEEGAEGAVAAARKLIEGVGAAYQVDDAECTIGVSIGIATYPADGTNADSLLRRADAAMYAAKRDRRGYQLAGHITADRKADRKADPARPGDAPIVTTPVKTAR